MRRALLALAVLALSWPAQAQVYPNIPANTVLGRLGAGQAGPPQPIPFATLTQNLPPPLVLNVPTGTLTQGFSIAQTGPSSQTLSNRIEFNQIGVTYTGGNTNTGYDSLFALYNGAADAFRVNLTLGSNNLVGAYVAGMFATNFSQASTSSATVVGLAGSVYSNVNYSNGSITGVVGNGQLGATGSANYVLGSEFDVGVASGGSVNNRYGVNIQSFAPVQGSTTDAAINFSNSNVSGGGFKKLFLLNSVSGTAPLDTGGDIFFASAASTIGNIFNLPTMTVSGDYFNFANFAMKGDGHTIIGAGSASLPSGTEMFHVTNASSGVGRIFVSTNAANGIDGFDAQDTAGSNELFAGVNEASNGGTVFGQSANNLAKVVSAGGTNLGLAIGTLTAEPLYIGTNNTLRLTISSAGLATFANGVSFGQSTLSNYTEGTWTPAVTTDGTVGTPAYTTQYGSYERIGRLIVARFVVLLSGWTGSPTGNVSISGLPVTSTSTTNDTGNCTFNNWVTSTSFAYMAGNVQPNTSAMAIRTIAAGGGASTSQLTASQAGTTLLLGGTCMYRT